MSPAAGLSLSASWYFFHFAFVGVFSPYFGVYLHSLRLTAWEIGLLMSVMQGARIVAPTLWGWLADHSGWHGRIIRVSAVCSLVGYSGFFFVDSFYGLAGLMLTLSVFWSAPLPLVEVLTLRLLGKDVGAYGRIRLWGSIGFILSVMGVGHALSGYGASVVLWAGLGTLAGVGAVGSAFASDAGRQVRQDRTGSLGAVLHRPEVRAFLGAGFLMSAAHGALYVFYSIFLLDHGYGGQAVGLLWALGVVAEIGVFIAMPALLTRFGVRRLLLASLLAAGVRFTVIATCVEIPWLLAGAQVLHGLTFGAFHASSVAAVNRWFAAGMQARGQALYGAVSFGVGGTLGGVMAGWIWEGFGGTAAFMVSAGLGLLGWALATFGMPRDIEAQVI